MTLGNVPILIKRSILMKLISKNEHPLKKTRANIFLQLF
jgi:hypothetical protein